VLDPFVSDQRLQSLLEPLQVDLRHLLPESRQLNRLHQYLLLKLPFLENAEIY
jgi:hypothetical protein